MIICRIQKNVPQIGQVFVSYRQGGQRLGARKDHGWVQDQARQDRADIKAIDALSANLARGAAGRGLKHRKTAPLAAARRAAIGIGGGLLALRTEGSIKALLELHLILIAHIGVCNGLAMVAQALAQARTRLDRKSVV